MPGGGETVTDSLFRAVLDAPDDEAPRLVYADALLERGDPRGEFIQIQCALGRSLVGARALPLFRDKDAKNPMTEKELAKREAELLKKHQKEWLAPIRPFIRTWRWKQGFVDSVEADAATFFANVSAIFAATPLRHVSLTALKKPTIDALAKSADAFLPLRALSLHNQQLGPKTAHLFHSWSFANLRELDLPHNALENAGVSMLASSPTLANLRTLNLSHSKTLVPGVEALSKSTFFPLLESLNLDSYDSSKDAVGPDAASIIAKSATSMRSLSLVNGRIKDRGLTAIAESEALQHLEELNVYNCLHSPAGAMAIAKSKYLQKIKSMSGLIGRYFQVVAEDPAAKALRARFGDAVAIQ
jgi:uncharacterized protein (TIGR02996 family)